MWCQINTLLLLELFIYFKRFCFQFYSLKLVKTNLYLQFIRELIIKSIWIEIKTMRFEFQFRKIVLRSLDVGVLLQNCMKCRANNQGRRPGCLNVILCQCCQQASAERQKRSATGEGGHHSFYYQHYCPRNFTSLYLNRQKLLVSFERLLQLYGDNNSLGMSLSFYVIVERLIN